jgi:hypothetical protein
MQYSRRLVEKASQIRSKYLNSNDFMDNIVTDESITVRRVQFEVFKCVIL